MGKAVFTLGVVLYLLSSAWSSAQNGTAPKQLQPVSAAPVIASAISAPTIIPLDQIHEGMKGTALTVFQGVKPESMEVEVLGVMRNVNGPKGDIILVRLHGSKPEYTGVVAGMSGSPVYFDGKLAGALAFRRRSAACRDARARADEPTSRPSRGGRGSNQQPRLKYRQCLPTIWPRASR